MGSKKQMAEYIKKLEYALVHAIQRDHKSECCYGCQQINQLTFDIYLRDR